MKEWVAKKNKDSLLKWLSSTNTERQMYGADGLFQLKKLGVPLSNNERKILKFVVKKRGKIYMCFGCSSSLEDIRAVTADFYKRHDDEDDD